jgi:hypothetical protein
VTNWRNRIVGHGEEDPEQLLANPMNWRVHPRHQQAALSGAISDVGFIRSVTVNKTTGHVVDGHLRVTLALRNGEKSIPVEYVELSEAEEAEALATLDPIAAMALADKEALDAVLREVQTGDAAVLEMLAALAVDAGLDYGKPPVEDAEPQIDKAEELRVKWGVETGSLWVLGDHKIICGDCTDRAVVERVMGGERADMVFTDPPYGHNNNDGDLIHNWEKALGRPQTASSAARPIANDSPEEAARVYGSFLATCSTLLKPGCCCCCCCGGGGGPDPQFARWTLEMDKAIGFKMAVVWDKGGLGMGWHYRRNYEFVLIAQQPGAACHWYGGNDVPNVIRDIGKIIPSASQHPTEKPVELSALFIGLHSTPGEIVFDPFCGSGTTLIACEQLRRKCRAVEISPGYVGVTLERFFDATGITPVQV